MTDGTKPGTAPMPTATADTRRRTTAISSAVRVVAMLVGLGFVYYFFVQDTVGQRLDVWTFASVDDINQGWGGLAGHIREDLPIPLAVLVVVLGIVALFERRWRGLLAAAVLLLVPYAVGHELKTELLNRPYLGANGYTYNTFPSGHTIVLASLLMAVALLLPRRLRRPGTSVLLAALTLLCAVSSVVSYAHRPSDIVSGLLIVGAVSVPAGLVAGRSNAVPWPRHTWGAVLAGVGASVLLYVVVWLRLPYSELEIVAGNLATLVSIASATFGVFAVFAEATGTSTMPSAGQH